MINPFAKPRPTLTLEQQAEIARMEAERRNIQAGNERAAADMQARDEPPDYAKLVEKKE